MLLFIHGDNTYASWQEVLTQISKNKLEFTSLSGDELSDVNQIFLGLDSYSLFATVPAVLVIKRLYNNRKKSLQQELLAQLQTRKDPNLHLIIWEDKKIEHGGKLLEYFKTKGRVQEFKMLNI